MIKTIDDASKQEMTYIIKGFNPSTFIDWAGKLACVIYLPGCNFRCPFCHSSSLVLKPAEIEAIPFVEIKQFLVQNNGWIDGLVVQGGEPTLYEKLPQLLKEIKSLNVQVKLDTNGSAPEVILDLIKADLVDYIAMDIKADLSIERYNKSAGVVVDLNKIKQSISILLSSNIDYEFRTTVVPGFVDADAIGAIAKFIRGAKRYTLQQFSSEDTLDSKMAEVKPYHIDQMRQFSLMAKKFVPNTSVRGAE
ncbi:MAG: anaerobic ribonucleoside-triphosphate reductase activating protein [Candidatus Omnitrophota bacterium]|nr:MAG: anaerobic ribonucleoside-triphosphate reductase activating protein [Candidatus Omnitrophota bacterium]